ncbi:MAG: superoxide dismutase [Planctomycetota bacterium]
MSDDLSRREMLAMSAPAALFGSAFAASALGQAAQTDPANLAGATYQPVKALLSEAWDGTQYTLPPLPYDYDALEPHIDEQTMRLHHDIHHQGYVNGLNKTMAAVHAMTASGEIDATKLAALQRNLSFHGGGHVMHTVFWATMSPNGGGAPEFELAEAIDKQYGSFDKFKAYFKAAAAGVKGSGWAVLGFDPIGGNLITFSMNDQDMRTMAGFVPLLPIDVWEHAYYLKYQNRRAEYIDNWFEVVNWPAVNSVYAPLKKMREG